MLDLNLLLVFEAMLLHRSVTDAAAHVGISQPAMSSALGRLRRHFDEPLFVNTRGGMLPTPRALELAKPLQQALSLVRSATVEQQPFDPVTSKRSFRFHMSDVGEVVFLPTLVKRLDEMGASVRVETAQLTADEVGEQLESGEIDFAAGYLPALSKSVSVEPLFREHYVCMTRRGHPIETGGPLRPKEFLGYSHVLIESMGSGHKVIERTLERHGLKAGQALRVPHFMVIPMIVASTDRIVTVPSRVATVFDSLMRLRVHPLPFRIPNFDVSLFWHPRFGNDAGIRWMRRLMLDLFHEGRGEKGRMH
ncbi:MAG TPA: LysR family transcriptional regulator [Casimicrobiaceae bacterium]|nr:LysR family transcriptional regulator [Casimicrobiaceae bacterium]